MSKVFCLNPSVLMSPQSLLRLEGLCVFLGAVAIYGVVSYSWWVFTGLLLAPDLFMVGYLAGPRLGAHVYNAGHTYVIPFGIGALGYILAAPAVLAPALIWTAHIGMDRTLGYGLKRPTNFHDTHLDPTRPSSPNSSEREPNPPRAASVGA